jgi:RNA-directed DNA polymerase
MINWLYLLGLSRLYLNRNLNINSNNNNLANSNDNGRMAQWLRYYNMKTYNKLYEEICSINNLANAWLKARKGKTKKRDVLEFRENLRGNLFNLRKELLEQTYKPKPLKTFILRDPKTRKISKSDFRDRIVHHALVRVLEPIFDKSFIYDSCANRKGKGNLFALKRFDLFKRKITCNLKSEAFCFKADIKHYFQEVDHEILLKRIRRKISDEKVIRLIERILKNNVVGNPIGKGMPLGNLTSQFFANVYLNELDYFIKHKLKAKFYIRYVDDFIILHKRKKQLGIWKNQIDEFLKKELKLELHRDKSKIILLSNGVDFVGFRNFYNHRLLRKRNITKMSFKIEKFENDELNKEKLFEIFQGWNAYSKWANTFKLKRRLRAEMLNLINPVFLSK